MAPVLRSDDRCALARPRVERTPSSAGYCRTSVGLMGSSPAPLGLACGRDLAEEIRLHLSEPFPSSAVRGLDYGEVDAVMIDADIIGWATRAVSFRSVQAR